MPPTEKKNRAKTPVPFDEIESRIPELLDEIQREMFDAALARREAATFVVDTWDDFKSKLDDPGGFILAHWCGDTACEQTIQDESRATIRVLAFDQPEEQGECVRCGGKSNRRVHFARAY